MERLDGWEARLDAVIEAWRHRPCVVGVHDCFRLACAGVQALTGVDRWPEFAGYRTERDVKELLARHGSRFEAAFDWFFGSPAVDTRQARRGDVCAIRTPDGQKHLGICLGINTACLVEGGLGFVPTMTCLCAWRVG